MLSYRRGLRAVILGSLLLLLLRAGSVPLLDPDESRFARTSVEMLRSGDLVVPQFEGQPRLVKPPLIHWIQSFLFRWFGPGEGVARLHAVVATLGSLLLVSLVCRRRFGDEAGVWAGAVFVTMPLVLVAGRVGGVDALLAVHVFAVVVLDLLRSAPADAVVLADDRGQRAPEALATGGLLGLAFLAKGPVGVVLPLLLILAGRTASGADVVPRAKTASQVLAGWCLVVLPWGLAFVNRVGASETLATLRSEVAERFFAATEQAEPAWYYATVLGPGLLPWVGPLLVALARTWRLRGNPVTRTARYAAAGLVAGTLFLSLSQGKRPLYLLPLAPLAVILIVWELGREVETPRERAIGSTLLAATLAATAILLALVGGLQLEGAAARVALAGAGIHAVGAVAAFFGTLARRPRQVYAAAAATAGLFLGVVVAVLFPALGATRSAQPLIEAVPALREGRPIVSVEIRIPSLTFYLDRAPELLEMDRLVARIAEDDAPLYVLADVDLPDVPPAARDALAEIGRHGKYRVFQESR